MIYLATVAACTVIPLVLGIRLGKTAARWCRSHPKASASAVILCAMAWLGAASWAREYADGDAIGWSVAEWVAHSGKWFIFAAVVLSLLGVATRTDNLGRARKVALVVCEVLVIWMLAWRTMPSYVWLPRSTTRDEQGHVRQSIEYTCAPVSLGNMLECVFGCRSPAERELARLSGTTVEGTRLKGLISAADALGLELVSCRRMRLHELSSLGAPAIVQISTLPTVRHATLLLAISGDSIAFVDPAYGYSEMTIERFAEIWYGKTVIFRAKDASGLGVLGTPDNSGENITIRYDTEPVIGVREWLSDRGGTGLSFCGLSVREPVALVRPGGGTPSAPKPLVGGDLDVRPRLCHAPPHDMAAPDRFRHAFGLCGPVPAEKRFLINLNQ